MWDGKVYIENKYIAVSLEREILFLAPFFNSKQKLFALFVILLFLIEIKVTRAKFRNSLNLFTLKEDDQQKMLKNLRFLCHFEILT